MLNPDKILGGLLRGNSRRSGMLGKLSAGSVGLGLLGVAMEAAEHLMNKAKTPQNAVAPPSPPGGIPPTPPPQPQGAVPTPPPPPAGPAAPPSPPPATETAPERDPGSAAVLLIRAMIAAANADGMIDEGERGRILDKLRDVELTSEEHAFIVQELLSPCDLDAIVRAVQTPDMAKQVYAVSLMAIEVDTDAERKYITSLADRLGLDDGVLDGIHRDLEIERL